MSAVRGEKNRNPAASLAFDLLYVRVVDHWSVVSNAKQAIEVQPELYAIRTGIARFNVRNERGTRLFADNA